MMGCMVNPVSFASRLALGIALSVVAAQVTYVVGTWALKGVVAAGLAVA